ncbi:cryptochrome/photolyase family protein [Caldovatus aquaticus]|uniref:DNA photolyase family protein n=1 Tax=Caldovatus aquaticus TaxID=2865671 RepID=A0ABS7F2E7_9PROT|nr:deoxyribodipyrimidine photo-lyase [Caldovatus aquaticus]MBW8269778.1 DNA photolyase family protein [Caldovatus aquaticus]
MPRPTSPAPVLIWFRQDLRLADNPALAAAGDRPVLPVFVRDEAAAGRWAPGGAARWWLHHSLAALAAALRAKGAGLHLARGRAEDVLPALARAVGADAVLANRLCAPWAREQERRVATALAGQGVRLVLHELPLLHDPEALRAGSGRAYEAFTPFARAVRPRLEHLAPPLPAPARLRAADGAPAGEALESWRLTPRPPDWAAAFPALWQPGEAGAEARLARFLSAGRLHGYAAARDRPSEADGTSGLSPHLHWGEISPRRVWHAVRAAAEEGDRAAAEPFLRELLWREFCHHLLWHRPELPERPLRAAFAGFPWAPDARLLRAWQRGETGFPIVDAGMRQLWRHGWMHNRVRMIAASVLVKHLLQPWHDGAAWFWDTLVDADLANNSANWQWVAGCGADAAPYFRIFNPVRQGERFDPEGRYVRRFVPELARLPDRFLHRPWEAPEAVRRAAGVVLGRDYPRPLVDPAAGRARALAAFAAMRRRPEAAPA